MQKINIKTITSILGVELCIFFNMDMFLSGFPIYVTMLGAKEDLMGVLFGAFMLSAMIFRPILARVGQRYGQKWVLCIGATVSFLAPWLYLGVDGFTGLIFVRMFHGLVPATFITATQLLLMRECGEERKSIGVGLFGVVGGISLMIIPYVGVHLLTEYGPFVWLLTASIFGLVACMLFWGYVYKNIEDVRILPGDYQKFSLENVFLPLTITILLALGFGSVIAFVSTYALSLGYSNPGQYFSVVAVVLIFARGMIALYGDRVPQRLVIILSVIMCSLGLLLLAFPPSAIWVIISAIPMGAGFFAGTGMLLLNVTNSVSPENRSMAAAFHVNSVDLGLTASSMLFGMILTRWSYQVLYGMNFVFAMLALIFVMFFLKERPIPVQTNSLVEGEQTIQNPQ